MEYKINKAESESCFNNCLVCFASIRPNKYSSDSIKLDVFSNILRLSPSIYQGLDIDKLQDPLYCPACTQTIVNAAEILQEIKNLENSLSIVTGKLKQDLIQGYSQWRLCNDGNNSDSSEDSTINLIRKTFVQCWSNCTVAIPKLQTTTVGNRPVVPKSVIDFSSLDNEHRLTEVPEGTGSKDNPKKTRRKATLNHILLKCEQDGDNDNSNDFFEDASMDFVDEFTIKSPSKKRKRNSVQSSKQQVGKVEGDVILEAHNPTQHDSNRKVKKSMNKSIRVRVNCTLCDKTFQTAAALTTHTANIHEKTYKFFCHICGQGFQVNSMLQRHINYVHSTVKNFECEICQKRFKRSHQLFYHKRVHTGERLICEICGRGFMQPEKLKLHLVIHTGEKRHPCPFCGKLFAVKQYVTNHIKDTHEGKRKGRNKKSTARVVEQEDAKLSSSSQVIHGDCSETMQSNLQPESESSLLLHQTSSDSLTKPAAEIWRRHLSEEIGVAEIEAGQDSQPEHHHGIKFSENYVFKYVSGT